MAGKKTFKDEINPAFIGTAAEGEAATAPGSGEVPTQPTRFTFQATDRELKTRRLQLLLKPSTYYAIKAQAHAHTVYTHHIYTN